MSAWAKRANPIAGAALALIAYFFLSADTCAAQQHKPLEPRQSPAAHHDAVALGGPTHGPATPAAGARFPIVPAGVVLTKAPAMSRPTRRLASNEVGASGPPAPSLTPHKPQLPAPRQTGTARIRPASRKLALAPVGCSPSRPLPAACPAFPKSEARGGLGPR